MPGALPFITELLVLIIKIDQVNWDAINPRNQQRGSNLRDRSPIAQWASSGDFAFYDPWDRTEFMPERATEIADAELVIPYGHGRGYAYCSFPDISGLQQEDYREEDVEDDELNCELRQVVAAETPDSAGYSELSVSNANVASDSTGSGILVDRPPPAREIVDDQIVVVRSFVRGAGIDIASEEGQLSALATSVRRQVSAISPASPKISDMLIGEARPLAESGRDA